MPDPQSILRERFGRAIAAALASHPASTPLDSAGVDPLIRTSSPTTPGFGDYQANVAMSLAKQLGRKPREVAEAIVAALDATDLCEKVEIAGPGFINLHLRREFLEGSVAELMGDPRLGVPPAARPQTVVVDYSSPNVAKEMHVGHLRSTVIGDALARVLEFLGHQVIRQNHLGDWGTQFGMLTEYLAEQGWRPGAPLAIGDLNALYQSAKKRFDEDAAFAELARNRVVLLQGGEERTAAMWRELIAESMRHFNQAYRRLGVRLADADVRGESFYNPRLPQVAQELAAQGVAIESQGALCAFPPGFRGPDDQPVPLIVRKSDGGYGYDTTDLAALRYRALELHADRIIYVTDARQKQHFAMVFQVAEQAGWLERPGGGKVRVEHVAFGTVLGKDGKPLKTRSGESVKLADLLDEADQRAMKIIEQKDPALPAEQRERVAQVVGVGAIKYADLVNDRIKDYLFDWERMLSFDGNTAPYIQNAYVRIRSIFRKGGIEPASLRQLAGGALSVREPAERALVLKLLQFSAAVEAVAASLEPHRLCGYLYELAGAFHQFYEACPVLTAEGGPAGAIRQSRLALCDLTARTLARGLGLLGIEVIEQM